jgi:small subunit ribosomal protein S16
MALKLRLARHGRKKAPFYAIVAADSRAPRDGNYLEKLGTYDPRQPKDSDKRVILNAERIQYWMSQGAQPTERVAFFLGKAGLTAMPEQRNSVKKSIPKAKAQERAKEKAQKAEAAKAAAEAPAEAPAAEPAAE